MGVHGYVLVFSVASRVSFEKVRSGPAALSALGGKGQTTLSLTFPPDSSAVWRMVAACVCVRVRPPPPLLQLRFINDTLLDAIGVDSVPRVLVGNKTDLVGAR